MSTVRDHDEFVVREKSVISSPIRISDFFRHITCPMGNGKISNGEGLLKLLDHLSEVAIQKVSPRVVHDTWFSESCVWHKTCGQSGALFNE